MMRNETRRRGYNRLYSARNIREEDIISLPISGRQQPRKTIKRRSNKYALAIGALCIVHALRQFLLLSSYTDDYLKAILHSTELGDRMLSSSGGTPSQLDHKKLNRRRRTTPLPMLEGSKVPLLSQISAVDDSKNTDIYAKNSVVAMYSTFPSFPITNHIGADDICGRHKTNDYSSSDHIIIYGILSQVGAELALALAEGCGVRHIFGLSDHLPNTEESARLEFLIRRIPSFRIKVGKGPLGNRATKELFESFMPTHVFYLEAEVNEECTSTLCFGSKQFEQLCNTIIKMKSKAAENEVGTNLLYVASIFPETKKTSSVEMVSALLGTYRMKYGLDARVLHLPYIYGPFKDGTLRLRIGEFIDVVSEMAGLDQDQDNGDAISKLSATTSFNITQPILSIADAIRSILASAKSGGIPNYESIPIFSPSKSQTTLLNLSRNLLLSFQSSLTPNITKETLDTSILPILSWDHKRTNPYRDPTDIHSSPKADLNITTLALNNARHYFIEDKSTENASFSQLERRQHGLFPCISVCASFVKCKSSIWDSVAPIAKKATEGCKLVLYVADFSPIETVLPFVRPSYKRVEWPRESICQLAFVSSKSTVVEKAIKDEVQKSKESSTDKTIEEWNGKVSSNGWTLVWVDKNDDSMQQADLMIPKIIPESVLSPNVEFVFYIEPRHFRAIPPLQMLFDLSQGTMVADAKIQDEYLIPERHVDFFIHAYDESAVEHLDTTKTDYISEAAKVIMDQNNETSLRKEDALQKFKSGLQNEAYSSSLIWQKEGGMEFELLDTTFMMYPVRGFRSRQFRCEWYEEQLFWDGDNNQKLEALSLSFVLNRWRRGGKLLQNNIDSKWGEMILLGENGEQLSQSAADLKKYESSFGENAEKLSQSAADLKKYESSFGENGEQLSQSAADLKKYESSFGENAEKLSPAVEPKKFEAQADPQYFLKVHSSIKVRKVYSDED